MRIFRLERPPQPQTDGLSLLARNLQFQSSFQQQPVPSLQRQISQPVHPSPHHLPTSRSLFTQPQQSRDSYIPTVQPNPTTREQILSGLTREHSHQPQLGQIGGLRDQSPVSQLPSLRESESPISHLSGLREPQSQLSQFNTIRDGHSPLSHLHSIRDQERSPLHQLGLREQVNQISPAMREQVALQQRLGAMGGLSVQEQQYLLERERERHLERLRNQQFLQQRELEMKHQQQQQQQLRLLQQRALLQERERAAASSQLSQFQQTQLQAHLLQQQQQQQHQRQANNIPFLNNIQQQSSHVQNQGLTQTQMHQLQLQQAEQLRAQNLARLRDEQLLLQFREGRISLNDLAQVQAQNAARTLNMQNRASPGAYIMTEGRERN
ncbi:hypothetical protein BT69DRAFT_191326 [Atractiella rhizophila]|nr:hypothetical protein BT69DRAFT_191326 [Atractiella rhizophila]